VENKIEKESEQDGTINFAPPNTLVSFKEFRLNWDDVRPEGMSFNSSRVHKYF
jgi:hypothetical protein